MLHLGRVEMKDDAFVPCSILENVGCLDGVNLSTLGMPSPIVAKSLDDQVSNILQGGSGS